MKTSVTRDQAKKLYPESDWKYDVSNGDTKLSYEEWVAHNLESEGLVLKGTKEPSKNKTLKDLIKDTKKRIKDYVKEGGSEHLYLDGKLAALEEVKSLVSENKEQKLSAQQIATILFSLRYLENTYDSSGYIHSEHIQGLEPMNQLEINRLCEDINLNRITL